MENIHLAFEDDIHAYPRRGLKDDLAIGVDSFVEDFSQKTGFPRAQRGEKRAFFNKLQPAPGFRLLFKKVAPENFQHIALKGRAPPFV